MGLILHTRTCSAHEICHSIYTSTIYLHKHNLFTQAQLSFYFNKQHNLRPENCLKGHSMHNALSPKGFGKLINEYLGPHFMLLRLFLIEIFGRTYFVSFTFFQIFGYELKPHLRSTKTFTRISWNSDRLAVKDVKK